MCETALQIQRS